MKLYDRKAGKKDDLVSDSVREIILESGQVEEKVSRMFQVKNNLVNTLDHVSLYSIILAVPRCCNTETTEMKLKILIITWAQPARRRVIKIHSILFLFLFIFVA